MVSGGLWDALTLGPARRRRWTRRRLAELDRLDALPPLASRRSSRAPGTALSLAVTVALLGGVAFVYDDWWEMAGPLVTGTPPAVHEQSSKPLGTPPRQASSSTDYQFMATKAGFGNTPVTFSPCRPINVVVNYAEAPPGAYGLLQEAMARVSEASGLVFTLEGETTEPPRDGRGNRDVARYGNRWSPVLVAWTDPSVIPELKGKIAGIGGPVGGRSSIPGNHEWVSGIVYLDGPDIATVLRRPNKGRAQARAIVMHELAHLVGLTHVEARTELMNARNDSGMLDFGDGDREGLRQLGMGRCS